MKCDFCEWRCELSEGKAGVCRMYDADEGVIRELFPNRWCTYGAMRIEALPFYHAYPGSRCLAVGTIGCNMGCDYCANAYVAKREPKELQERMFYFLPQELVQMAQKQGCHSIVFNVNEPTVSLPTLLEVSKLAKQNGIMMGCLTNAFQTEKSLELLAQIFSFINVSFKTMSNGFAAEYLGISDYFPVMRNLRALSQMVHLEVTTPIIQNLNDEEIDEMANFLAEIDNEVPWHVFRLLPEYKMKETDYPGVTEINEKLAKHRRKMPYIYFHNFIGSDWVDTFCPSCGTKVIERFSLGCGGDKLASFKCNGNLCQSCGAKIAIHGLKTEWNSKEEMR